MGGVPHALTRRDPAVNARSSDRRVYVESDGSTPPRLPPLRAGGRLSGRRQLDFIVWHEEVVHDEHMMPDRRGGIEVLPG